MSDTPAPAHPPISAEAMEQERVRVLERIMSWAQCLGEQWDKVSRDQKDLLTDVIPFLSTPIDAAHAQLRKRLADARQAWLDYQQTKECAGEGAAEVYAQRLDAALAASDKAGKEDRT